MVGTVTLIRETLRVYSGGPPCGDAPLDTTVFNGRHLSPVTRTTPFIPAFYSVLLSPSTMQSINRFLYGPTAEEKVRAWQAKLRSEQRSLEREMRQVRCSRLQLGLMIDCPGCAPSSLIMQRRRHSKL